MTVLPFHKRDVVSVGIFCALLATPTYANAQVPGTDATQSARDLESKLATTAEGMIVAPADTLKDFRPLVPGHAGGPNILEIEGDPQNGPSITLFSYRNNYEGSRRLHTHTYTYRSVLIEGEMKHWDANGSEATAPILRPGSYWRQPGGELHADHCLSERCIALVTFEGPIDADFRGGLLGSREVTP